MNEFIQWYGHPVIHRVGWTLLHFLWQGAVVAGLFAIVQTGQIKLSSNARYWIGCMALLLMFVVPVITFVSLGAERSIPAALSATGARSDPANPRPLSKTAGALVNDVPDGQPHAQEGMNSQLPKKIASVTVAASALNSEVLIRSLVFAWLLGVSALTLRLLCSSLRVARMKRRRSEPLDAPWMARLGRLKTALQISRPVRLVKSALVEVPSVVGWLRPVILLPAATLAGLTPAQLESILVHELAHVRRHDYVVNLLQNALETLLFYHPAVWWVSNCVRAEREICCDEIAVQLCGDRLVYAKALTMLEELRVRRPTLALGADGGSLLERIRRLSGAPAGGSFPNRRRTGGVLVAALVSIIFIFLLHQPSTNAKAQATPQAATKQTNAAAGTFNSSKPAANPSGLSLVIRCTNEVLKVGDEIPIEFIISNHGTEDYTYGRTSFGDRFAEFELLAKTTSGVSLPRPPFSIHRVFSGPFSILHPGESISKIIPLNYWAAIKEPGRYEVTGTYHLEANSSDADVAGVVADPISITVQPRPQEALHDYIKSLSNQVAVLLDHPAFPPDPLPGLLVKLMDTCSPEIVPILLRTMYESGSDGYWEREALLYYVPHTEETQKAILEAVALHGLNENMVKLLYYEHYEKNFDREEMKPIIERALAADNIGQWIYGANLAAYSFYDDTFAERLIAIAGGAKIQDNVRAAASLALALHPTDAGVKMLKTLLNDPDPEIWAPLASAIWNGFSIRIKDPTGRHLQPGDINATDVRPLVERLLASSKSGNQRAGLDLADLFGDDLLTPKLVALATKPDFRLRDTAIKALAFNRTDDAVKTLKALLNGPDPKISKMAESAIRDAYTSRGVAQGRPLRADDFDPKFQQPEVTPAK